MNKKSSLYIELFKKILTGDHRLYNTEYFPLYKSRFISSIPLLFLDRFLRLKNHAICIIHNYKKEMFVEGKGWPTHADTMIGLKRLENIEQCVEDILENNIPGDLMEAGVWRGGAAIFMRALLKDKNIGNRIVWLADSFQGLPKPDPGRYPADKGDKLYKFEELIVPLEDVKYNFEKYNLLDEQVKFLEGWFKDTLPSARVQQLALLRIDGDMYESTMDVLKNMYPKLSKGGYVIVDDYGGIPACKKAVHDYREQNNVTAKIETIDWTGVYWKK